MDIGFSSFPYTLGKKEKRRSSGGPCLIETSKSDGSGLAELNDSMEFSNDVDYERPSKMILREITSASLLRFL